MRGLVYDARVEAVGAAARAVTAAFPRDQVTAVLLASDGAFADVLDYRRHDWGQVLRLAAADPAGYLRDIHAAEDADHDGRRWPRTKRHDDKTLALVRPLAKGRLLADYQECRGSGTRGSEPRRPPDDG